VIETEASAAADSPMATDPSAASDRTVATARNEPSDPNEPSDRTVRSASRAIGPSGAKPTGWRHRARRAGRLPDPQARRRNERALPPAPL